jgi:hypothetical protein
MAPQVAVHQAAHTLLMRMEMPVWHKQELQLLLSGQVMLMRLHLLVAVAVGVAPVPIEL